MKAHDAELGCIILWVPIGLALAVMATLQGLGCI